MSQFSATRNSPNVALQEKESVTFDRIADVYYSIIKYRANFHAKIDILSDIKHKAHLRWFDGWFADESGRIRFVCFSANKHALFQNYARADAPLFFRNILIQRRQNGSSMEVVVSNENTSMKSPKKIRVSSHLEANPDEPRRIKLHEVPDQIPGQMVDIYAKVVDLAPLQVSFGRTSSHVRSAGVSDRTEATVVKLWGSDAENVVIGTSYDFRFSVKYESGEYSLFTPLNGRPIIPIDDLEDVAVLDVVLSPQPTFLRNVSVLGIAEFESYHACCRCTRGKATPVEPPRPYARCANCGTIARIADCPREATALLILQNDTHPRVELRANSAALEIIANSPVRSIEEEDIFNAGKFDVSYSNNKIIIDVFRPSDVASAATQGLSQPPPPPPPPPPPRPQQQPTTIRPPARRALDFSEKEKEKETVTSAAPKSKRSKTQAASAKQA
ncbi:uncharacterized protein [Oscarella lobularis]|uniref:uncharacterized protein n=1 Tax=Oscarella lobularis TaxID=121494 RepID=UPI003313AC0F